MNRRNHFATEFALLLLIASVACVKHGKPPLTLEECDPAGFIPCVQAAGFVSLPIADSNLFLTYSSRWKPGVRGEPDWDARFLGLGGWSINVVQRYDSANGLLISGDGSWRLGSAVKLPSGEVAIPSFDGSVAYIFDSAGRHIRTVDGRLGTDLIRISYDSAGRLLSAEGSANGQPVRISVQRDSRGVAHAIAGIDGGTTTLAIDDNGHLTSVTDPAGNATRITWNNAGLVESLTDPIEAVTRFTYDDSHRLATTTDPDDVVQTFQTQTSADSLEVRVSTKLGRHWSYRAETTRGGIRRTFTGRDGTNSSETIDSNGVRKVELSDGTRFRIGVVPDPVWHMAAPNLTPVEQTRSDGITSRREVKYNLQPQHGLPYMLSGTITTVINGQSWAQHFDPAGRTADLVDPSGRRTVSQYDERGHLVTYSAPGTAPVSYAYNSEGRRVSATIRAGSLAHTTRYSYDPNTGTVITTLPDGTTQTTKFENAGREAIVSSNEGSSVTSYDAAGRVVQIQPPGGLNFTLGNSPAGRPTALVPPMVGSDGSAETSSYDADGQLTNISGLGARVVNIFYDFAGKPTSWTFGQGKRTVSYNPHSGLMSEANDPSGVKTRYSYVGNVPTGLKWSGSIKGAISVALDSDGRVARESVNGSSQLDYKYDSAGNLVGIGPLSFTRDPISGLATRSIVGVVETKQEFDVNRQLVRRTTTGAGKLVLDQYYTYDSLGRIKSLAETAGDGKSRTAEYSYDRSGRLAAVRGNGQAAVSYSYDPAGNRIGITQAKTKQSAVYDDRDRLVAEGDTKFAWTPDGKLLQRVERSGTTQFVYDDFGALRRVKLANGREIKYVVDADGRRVGRETAGKVTGYLYGLDGSVAAEMDGAGKIISRFVYDHLDHLAIVERSGTIYGVITDQLGSPRLILDSRTGAVTEQVIYDAWGNVTQDSAPGFLPIGFAGGLRDPDTGLIRLGARDYDPTTGRWTAADPIRFAGGDANLYRYAASDPVNRVDRSGLDSAGIPMPLGPPDKGITPFFPGGPGTPIGWRRPSGGEPGPSPGSGGGCDWDSAAWIGSLGGDLPPPCNNELNPPEPDDPNGNSNSPHHGSPPPPNCHGFWCFGQGPPTFCWACVFGDTHVQIANRLYFDFQAAGEFLAAASSDGKVVVQSRQEPVLGGTEVTFDTAVAANVNGDRVGVYAKEPSFLMVNGAPVERADVERRLPHGGKLQRHGGIVRISWPDGTRLNVTRLGSTLNYGINPPPNTKPAFSGLLGNSGGADELTGRDGLMLNRSDPAFQAKLYRQFGNSWRIKQSESLFHYWPGESTATFTHLNIPSKEVRAASLPSPTRSHAESVCRAVGVRNQPALDDCVLDVGITGIPAFAAASIGMEARLGSGAAPSPATTTTSSAAGSSTIAPSDKFNIHIGDSVSLDHPARGAGQLSRPGQTQAYSFSAHAGDSIYVAVGPCDGASPNFTLVKPDNSVLDGVASCRGFGPIKLPISGSYRIEARANAAPARYTFALRTAALDEFSIKIGDAVSPDHPAGAGMIKQPGERQSYSFNARSGDITYVGIGPCDGTPPILDIFAPDNHRVDGQIGCHDLGRVVLPQNGKYRILVRADGPSVRYSFSLHPVPSDQRFVVRLPLTASPDIPARGAGRIAAQGAQQSYDFEASPGSQVHVEGKCGTPCPNLGIRVTQVGDNGGIGFLGLDHLNFAWKMPRVGKYTIQVRSGGYVGSYSFTAYETKQRRR